MMPMSKRIIIFGTGGNCIDILDTLNDINDARGKQVYECAGFLDDDEKKWGTKISGAHVLGPLASASKYDDCFFINGIGSPSNFWRKREIIARAGLSEERFETIIHPTASVSRLARLGHGVVVFQNVTITSNAVIGNHVIILPTSVISHDCVVGDYTCITGGVCVSGGVKMGHSCYVGTHASIKGNLTLGDCVLVGMGSVVLQDIPANSVVVGNPAHFLRKTVTE
jgi:sugar O-acyltransferase (sialic acid O-acetyltransferase NeuD family)